MPTDVPATQAPHINSNLVLSPKRAEPSFVSLRARSPDLTATASSAIEIHSDSCPSARSESASDVEDPQISLARDNIRAAQDKMVARYAKYHKIESFAIGDVVLVKLPRGIRTATDQRKLYCLLIGCEHQPPRYKIQSKFGIINRMFPTKELKSVPKNVADTIDIGDVRKEITLSQAAKLNSSGTRVVISCQCSGMCSTNCCWCFKNNVKCSVHCHRTEHDCGYLKDLTERTEYSLVDRSDEDEEER